MSEYKPLHELILEGLEEGTVLERNNGVRTRYTWDGRELRGREGYLCLAPEDHNWRVISTPPKKIEFEVTCDETGYPLIFTNAILKGLYGDTDPLERAGRVLRVTVEEKR